MKNKIDQLMDKAMAFELAKKRTHTFFQDLKKGKHDVVLNHQKTTINVVIEKLGQSSIKKTYWIGIDGVQHRIFKAPKGYMVLFVFGARKYTKTYRDNQLYFN